MKSVNDRDEEAIRLATLSQFSCMFSVLVASGWVFGCLCIVYAGADKMVYEWEKYGVAVLAVPFCFLMAWLFLSLAVYDWRLSGDCEIGMWATPKGLLINWPKRQLVTLLLLRYETLEREIPWKQIAHVEKALTQSKKGYELTIELIDERKLSTEAAMWQEEVDDIIELIKGAKSRFANGSSFRKSGN